MIDTNTLNKYLIHSLQEGETPLGLADGRMGFSIYFYMLGRYEQNDEYRIIAEELLDKVFENIREAPSIDLKNGLMGIGLSINYLIRYKYVRGDINKILSDIDDVIFKRLSYSKYSDTLDLLTLIHSLYYLCIRLDDQQANSDSEYFHQKLIIETLNKLYKRIDWSFFEEPLPYDIDYKLPLFLYILGKIYSFNFYNCRVQKIIEELSPKILSTIPILHANRLYLWWGMDSVNKYIQIQNWETHMDILRTKIDINILLKEEIRNKNIYFKDGLSSIWLLLFKMKESFADNTFKEYQNNIIDRIRKSSIWSLLGKENYFNIHCGLLNGFTGINLILKELENPKKR